MNHDNHYYSIDFTGGGNNSCDESSSEIGSIKSNDDLPKTPTTELAAISPNDDKNLRWVP